MEQIKYILVNETGSNEAARAIGRSRVSDFRHCIIVNSKGLSRGELINELLCLRSRYPKAKILGLSEINPTATHAPVRVNPAMNVLRLELSDRP